MARFLSSAGLVTRGRLTVLTSRLSIASARAAVPAPARRFLYKATGSPSSPPSATSTTYLARAAGFTARGFIFIAIGFVMAAAPALDAARHIMNPPLDQDTLAMCAPTSEDAKAVEDHINSHPLVLALRNDPTLSESRPHMKIPPAYRSQNFTGGTLMGPGRMEVPPFAWAEAGGKSYVSVYYLGSDLCGHPGIVHGGLLATLLDEGLARCCFAALPHNVGMTANLNINYRSPARARSYVVLKAKTTRVEGRKAWVEGHLETLAGEGEEPVVIADASAFFISPRQAATMAKVYPVS